MQKTIHDDRYRLLIAQLKDAREKSGLRQIDVARALGFSRTWLTKVEQCEIRLDLLQLMQLAAVYGLDARELVGMLS